MQEGRIVPSQPAGQEPQARTASRGTGARDEAWRRFSRAASAEEFCQAWLAIQCAQVGDVSDGVVLLRQPGQESLAPAAFHPVLPSDRTLFVQVIDRALAEGRGVVLPRLAADEQPVAYQLALPLQVDDAVCGAVALQIAPRGDAEVRAAMRDLQWGSGWLEAWLRRQAVAATPGDSGVLQLQLALELVATLLEHPRLAEGGPAFVTELASRLRCDRVALGLRSGGRSRLEAM
jgi:hypothetical protein